MLEQHFDTTQPTHEDIEACDDLFDNLERGMAIYIIVYKNRTPDELYFAGYSFD